MLSTAVYQKWECKLKNPTAASVWFCISQVKSSCQAVFAVLLKKHKESLFANESFQSSEVSTVSVTLVLPLI